MQRIFLMPKQIGPWRRAFFSVVLASVEFFVAFLAIIGGVPILLNPAALAPTSIMTLMPLWMVYLWSGGLVLGGVLAIAGIVMFSYRMERMGSMTLAMTALIVAVALIAFLPASWLAFVTYLVFMFAMLARYWVLGKVLKVMQRVRTNGD